MLKEELKKIWRPGMVLLLIFLGVIYYEMFLDFYIRFFPNGPQNEGIVMTGEKLVERFGTSLSKEEAAEWEKEIPALYERAGMFLKGNEIAGKYGISTYEEFLSFCDETMNALEAGEEADLNENYADMMRMESYLSSGETGNIGGMIYGAEWFMRFYHSFLEYGAGNVSRLDGTTERELKHAEQKFFGENKLWQNIMPWEVPDATSMYLGYLLIFMCLSICLLLSPLQVHDRMSRMEALQYSSKKGRRVYLTKFYAVMLSAFLLTTGNLVIFGALFSQNGTAVFASCRMYSFASSGACWPDWTYKGWCLTLVVLCYLVAMGTAAAAFFLSGYSSNYIAMLLKLIPVFTALAILIPKILCNAFYYKNEMYRLIRVPYVEAGAAAVIFAAGIALSISAYRNRLTASL